MITEIRGGYNVKRFHTTSRTQEETVGHHSANVAAILLRLDPDCSRDLLVAALMHDVPEVYTGDVPAPFKWDNRDVKEGLDEGEDDYCHKHNIPVLLLEPDEELLLKAADMTDLVLSSIEDWGRGNMASLALVRNGAKYLSEMGLPTEVELMINDMVVETKLLWELTRSPSK